jgi:hypothetical protein
MMKRTIAFLISGASFVLKLAVLTVVYAVFFIVSNALAPFSAGFKELNSAASGSPDMSIGGFLFTGAWVCFTVYFIVTHSRLRGFKLFASLAGPLFFIQYVMTQIETLFFGNAFAALTRLDIALITITGLAPTAAVVLLAMVFFKRSKDVTGTAVRKKNIPIRTLLVKLGAFGFIYLAVYMVFGYFVAWQSEPLRVFYTGLPDKLSFFGQLMFNAQSNRIIYPFQILRGILFGAAVLPLWSLAQTKRDFTISTCLVYLCCAVVLIVPNPLFPDAVRYAHLIEMASSMLLLGIIAGNLIPSGHPPKTP